MPRLERESEGAGGVPIGGSRGATGALDPKGREMLGAFGSDGPNGRDRVGATGVTVGSRGAAGTPLFFAKESERVGAAGVRIGACGILLGVG